MSTYNYPKPLFDTLDHLVDQYKKCQKEGYNPVVSTWLKSCLAGTNVEIPKYAIGEYYHSLIFLYNYRGSPDTLNSYRREIERFISWSWFVHKKSILELKRLDIEEFLEFCQEPPKRWINLKVVSRFTTKDGERLPNPEWRPFTVKVSKKAFQEGEKPAKSNFEFSQATIKAIFGILGSFYTFLIQEEVTEINPILQIKQKSKFIRKQTNPPIIRRLSEYQWKTVLETANKLAQENPDKYRRTLFIMQALYSMYLRISELAASPRWQPKMSDFFRDTNGDWWFKTVGKGNKLRQIAVSPDMLQALRDYREYLGYTPLPTPDDKEPLIPKAIGKGPVESTRLIRLLVQSCFNKAVEQLREERKLEEAEMLRSATVH